MAAKYSLYIEIRQVFSRQKGATQHVASYYMTPKPRVLGHSLAATGHLYDSRGPPDRGTFPGIPSGLRPPFPLSATRSPRNRGLVNCQSVAGDYVRILTVVQSRGRMQCMEQGMQRCGKGQHQRKGHENITTHKAKMADIPPTVLKKLIFFTAMMIMAPLVAFFITNAIFSNSLVSGGVAAVVANIVLIGYVYVAFNEELDTDKEKKSD